MIVICDIDNCIADDNWRLARIRQDIDDPFFKYHQYHIRSIIDNAYNIDVVRSHKLDGHEIVFATSRPEPYRKITEKWMDKNEIPFDLILMRPMNDFKPSPVLKLDMLRKAGIYPDNVLAAYDDRHDILHAYKSVGFDARRLFIAEQLQGE